MSPADPSANTPLQIEPMRRQVLAWRTNQSVSVVSSIASKIPSPPGRMTVSNWGQGSKMVRSGMMVTPLDELTAPRVVPIVMISYSPALSPRFWLSTFTSPKASLGPAISSNWKRGNSTIPTLILRIS
jgi:hypothetical protein